MAKKSKIDKGSKDRDLEAAQAEGEGARTTTNQGAAVEHTEDSLKAGLRGPTLMEDFHFREKMTHFDHERIPERVVHARGSGAHGYFQVYESLAELTRAHFLQDPSQKTPVFVRFSTVVGSRGSADTVRDARGWATKFYTQEGNFDLVGNNIPVFFIQDAVKFPDLVHAVKPEPHNEMLQAAAAHDTFWDFISLMPESMHMILWVLSDRALPRSYRMMDGFGIHTFRLINAHGKARFVKFHWKPLLGVHSLVWDECQKLAGMDPDFHRRDLWEAIELGVFPEYELGLQVVEEKDERKLDFDLLDPTKIIPEEVVPVRPVGKMVLNRNPDNFFAEVEQAAFHPGHLVPGIDFSNDPLLQGRLFSYLDTQLIRLGGPNFSEIPINRPLATVHNNQRDGHMRQTIDKGRVSYQPSSLGGQAPTRAREPGFVSHPEKMEGAKVRQRSDSFKDHFSQATLFWNSMSAVEKEHLVAAAHFELGKVETEAIRQRMVELFNQVDHDLATRVAAGIGVAPPAKGAVKNHGRKSPALSMENTRKDSIQTRRVAALVESGFDQGQLTAIQSALVSAGAKVHIVSKALGSLKSSDGGTVEVTKTYQTAASVMFDAVFVPGGKESVEALRQREEAVHFVREAFWHGKAIAALGEGVDLLAAVGLKAGTLADAAAAGKLTTEQGVITFRPTAQTGSVVQTVKKAVGASREPGLAEVAQAFIQAIAQHRHWGREIGRQG